MTRRYSTMQIALHWIIVVLIPIQYLTGGSIERTHHAVHLGMTPARWDIIQHFVHNYCGMAIGCLMGLRLVLRLARKGSAEAVSTLGVIARTMHFALYGAIIAQACLGFVASYLTFSVAPLHVAGSWVILGMVAIHVFAAAWHTLVLKDDTIDHISMLPRKTTD